MKFWTRFPPPRPFFMQFSVNSGQISWILDLKLVSINSIVNKLVIVQSVEIVDGMPVISLVGCPLFHSWYANLSKNDLVQ